jgi:hypothetical protein
MSDKGGEFNCWLVRDGNCVDVVFPMMMYRECLRHFVLHVREETLGRSYVLNDDRTNLAGFAKHFIDVGE